MKVYRYNAEKREDRKFNTTGKEKNPLKFSFYANTMEYADKYKFVYDADGDVKYTCTLEEKEIEISNLFDMTENFRNLNIYKELKENKRNSVIASYESSLSTAKKASDKKLFQKFIDETKSDKFDAEFDNQLFYSEFQLFSDFENQYKLVKELVDFSGYTTKNETVLF